MIKIDAQVSVLYPDTSKRVKVLRKHPGNTPQESLGVIAAHSGLNVLFWCELIVKLFAFDKGQGLSEHTAPFDAFVNILDGKAEVFISGKSNMLNIGEFIIMPANEPHSLKAVEKFKMVLVLIKK